jgi:hypothetical protein
VYSEIEIGKKNMDKRYQVFVSSTYEDLIEERLEVMKALLELDCIPCGMEYFPAANEDQWTFIKNLIDVCDYYVVIIGGRYGSEDAEGKSYTQKEYEYALSKGIPTIGFIRHNLDALPPEKKEEVHEKIQNLEEFIALVRSKLCKDWGNSYELGAVVSRSLTQLIKSNPRTGWIRADRASNEDILNEINILRKDNENLKTLLQDYKGITEYEIKDLAALDEIYEVKGTYYRRSVEGSNIWSVKESWRTIFKNIAPSMLKQRIAEDTVSNILVDSFFDKSAYGARSCYLDDQVLQTIKVQLMALGLVKVEHLKTTAGGMALFWSLTPKGEALMFETRTIRAKQPAYKG